MTFHRLFDGSKAQKLRKCPECGDKFIPLRKVQPTCENLACMQLFALKVVAKAERKREKVERANDRQKREQLKTRSQWMSDAQDAFNAFIRERDKDQPCICCGKFPDSTDWKPGGVWDAGHFLGRGAYPELRFVESNCHRQLKTCNGGSAKYAKKGRTVAQGYEEGIRARIGDEAVDWLKGPHEPKHYTIEDLKAIKARYVAKLKELQHGQ